MTTTLLALIASSVFLLRLLPQPVRLVRHGVDAGVSPLAAMNAVVADSAWLAYGLWAGIPAVWIVSVLALIPGLWTVALLRHKARAREVGLAALWAGAIALSAPLGVLAGALGAGVIVTHGPQVLTALRESDLRGIAPMTWRLALADALCWGAYGWAIADPALLGYFAVLSTSAVIVLVRLRQTEVRRAPQPLAVATATMS
jgi:uncharacterized protein with PQ loop repeat